MSSFKQKMLVAAHVESNLNYWSLLKFWNVYTYVYGKLEFHMHLTDVENNQVLTIVVSINWRHTT